MWQRFFNLLIAGFAGGTGVYNLAVGEAVGGAVLLGIAIVNFGLAIRPPHD